MNPAQPGMGNGVEHPSRGISGLKFLLAILAVFAVQVALTFWIGYPPAVKHFEPPTVPVIYVADDRYRDLLAINDPTLFILPHRENFSGDAWLKTTPLKFSPTNWTEPARPLELPREQLGGTFVAFMQTNRPARFHPRIDSGLDTATAAATPLPPISIPSQMFVEGDLAHLRLLTRFALPPRTNSDLLTNTVIQMTVDAQGYPYSWVISSGSGSDDADRLALTNYARAIRFSPPVAEALSIIPADKMVSGRLIFEWQTVPPAPTNTPSATP